MGPLSGLKIVEIASIAPAPFGCMLLADLGADVLRVERLGSAASFEAPPGPLDRGRRAIALDLKSADGVEVVKSLIRDADVLVEGFRPGVAERLGIGPEELMALNPRLIYARMTGWGQEGPLAARAGHDIDYVAIAGALEPIGRAGEAPHAALNLVGDFAGGGSFLALGILAAVIERSRSGLGQVVDAAMVDGASTLMSFVHGLRAAGMWGGPRGTNLLDGGAAFYDTYETSDGKYMAVGAVEPQFYALLLDQLGLDASALPAQMNPSGWPEVRTEIAEAFKTRTREEWTTAFADSDACVVPVLSPWEAHEHPHNKQRNSFIEINGTIQPAPAPRFGRSVPATPVGMDDGGRDVIATMTNWGLDSDLVERVATSGAVR